MLPETVQRWILSRLQSEVVVRPVAVTLIPSRLREAVQPGGPQLVTLKEGQVEGLVVVLAVAGSAPVTMVLAAVA
jgi:hypothetical protein